jgi:hypothetical protein
MCNVESKTHTAVVVTGDPGICGFPCTIQAEKCDKRVVSVTIVSECKQIQRLGGFLTQISLKELFMPITRNPVYVAAEKSGCHAACSVPVAVIKAVEVALGLALPQEVSVKFTKLKE